MNSDIVIIGAGAAGLMAAARAGLSGKSVLLIDHAPSIGEKIRISGGGRCNFTNIHTAPSHFISANAHFCKSALSRYTPQDFIKLVTSYGIAYHDKGHGQLFCNEKATQIVEMLVSETTKAKALLWSGTEIHDVSKENDLFYIETDKGLVTSPALVVATGGLSIPKIGASSFGYRLAEKFGHPIIPTRSGLVPLTFTDEVSQLCADLTGLSVDPVRATAGKKHFDEALLFTHRGLSGPAILQISSYWREGESLSINLMPERNALTWLKDARKAHPKRMLHTMVDDLLPQRLALALVNLSGQSGQMANLSDKQLAAVAQLLNNWTLKPNGTEGYRTAEVTLGGVDTSDISSKTFESRLVSGLYFIGEVLDVTGHLGGFNFQWAWSSGYCCGEALAQ
ncbi:MAG: NAD(P)/FAD-dependent oxidoreductase [Pseudobdellovibrionaceae bacterium]